MEDILITNTISEFKFSNIPKIFITSGGDVDDPNEYISDTEECNRSTIKDSSHPHNNWKLWYSSSRWNGTNCVYENINKMIIFLE